MKNFQKALIDPSGTKISKAEVKNPFQISHVIDNTRLKTLGDEKPNGINKNVYGINKKIIYNFKGFRKNYLNKIGNNEYLSNSFSKLERSNAHETKPNSHCPSQIAQAQIKEFSRSNNKQRSLSTKINSNSFQSLLPTNEAQIRATPKFKMAKDSSKQHPPFIPKLNLSKDMRDKKTEIVSQSNNTGKHDNNNQVVIIPIPSRKKDESSYEIPDGNIPPFKKPEISEQNKMEFTFKASIMHSEFGKIKEHGEKEPELEENSQCMKHHLPLLLNNHHIKNFKAKLMNFQNLKKFNFKIVNSKEKIKIQVPSEQETLTTEGILELQNNKNKNTSIKQSTSINERKSHPEENKNLKMKPPKVKSFKSTEKLKILILNKNQLKKSSSSLILPRENDATEFDTSNRNSQMKTFHSNCRSLSGTPKIIRNHPRIKHFFD